MREHVKCFLVFSVILLFATMSYSQVVQEQSTLLNLSNVKIDRNNPFKANYNLNQGDVLDLGVLRVGSLSRGKLSDLNLKFTRNSDSYEQNFDIGASAQKINITERGVYSIEITSDSRREIYVNMRFSKSPPDQLEEGDLQDVAKLKNTAVGMKVEGRTIGSFPKIAVDALAGDKLTFSSAAENAEYLKIRWVAKDEVIDVASGQTFIMDSDGIQYFEYYFDLDKEGLIPRLFGKGENAFVEDLHVRREVAVVKIDEESGLILQEEGQAGAIDDQLGADELDPNADFREASLNMQDAIAQSNEDLKALLENLNRKQVDSVLNIMISDDVPGTIWPKMDLIHDRRVCHEILLDENAGFWAFWLGVGSDKDDNNAFTIYDEQESSTIENTNNRVKSLLHEYIKYVLDNKGRYRMPGEELYQKAEFAIVDEYNKEKFEQGRIYRNFYPLKAPSFASMYCGAYGIPATQLYLCISNPNELTPLDFYFKAESFQFETFEK